MVLPAYEKLGVFYLGRHVDDDTPFLFDANHLLTHGVVLGMTGSGKTGLALSILEEAAIDGVPVLAIDPKGDLANLALAFPSLDAASFAPWVPANKDPSTEAAAWREGLVAWDQDEARIARLCAAREVTVYTPGSDAGTPLAMLSGFAAPPESLRADGEAFAARLEAAVSGLLGWLAIEGDLKRSREHLLLSAIVERAWRTGEDLDLPRLVRRVQDPGFAELGVLDLEAMYPKKERFELAVAINGLLVSPSFSAWQKGVPLDVGALLYGTSGKPRTSIVSIAHLTDAERMFVVTLLLHAVVAWMREQSGTQSLRALLYMDEIAGSMPPVANPPSKAPWLLLMKQARAFGLGIVVATQNPIDLDYKALANAGTWFLGKLQTERDKARVLEGLEGALGSQLARGDVDRALSALKKREFLVHDVHAEGPTVMTTRWAMSYLRGPLTKDELRRLPRPTPTTTGNEGAPEGLSATAAANQEKPPEHADREKPALASGIAEVFLPTASALPHFRAEAIGVARVRFSQPKLGIDASRDVIFRAPIPSGPLPVRWEDAAWVPLSPSALLSVKPERATFAPLEAKGLTPKAVAAWKEAFAKWLEANQGYTCARVPALAETAHPQEPEHAFRARLATRLREERDRRVAELRAKYEKRFDALRTKMEAAHDRVEKERAERHARGADATFTAGASVLGALLGRRSAAGLARSAAAVARGAARAQKDAVDVQRAEARVTELTETWHELESAFQNDAARIAEELSPEHIALESVVVRPKARDIQVDLCGIAWVAD